MKKLIYFLSILFFSVPIMLIYFLTAPILIIGQLSEIICHFIEQYLKCADRITNKFK